MEKVKAAVEGSWSSMTSGLPPVPPPPAAPTWTAPASSMAPPTVPAATTAVTSTSTGQPIDPAVLLDELVVTIGGVRSAILASVDGFGLARSSSMNDEASHPAMLAAAVGLGHQLVAMGGGSQLRQLVVDHDGGLLLVWPIGDQRVLAVLAASTVEQKAVRSFVRSRIAALSGATS